MASEVQESQGQDATERERRQFSLRGLLAAVGLASVVLAVSSSSVTILFAPFLPALFLIGPWLIVMFLIIRFDRDGLFGALLAASAVIMLCVLAS